MKKALLVATAALTALSGTAASAQSYEDHRARWEQRQERQRQLERREDRREDRQERREDRREQRQWARGQHLPAQYRGGSYVVHDYSRYGLSAPRPGYQYVRSGNDILLTAIASGLIGLVIGNLLGNNNNSGYSQPSYGYGQYGYSQPGYGYSQPTYGYSQPSYGQVRGYDRYGRPIYY